MLAAIAARTNLLPVALIFAADLDALTAHGSSSLSTFSQGVFCPAAFFS